MTNQKLRIAQLFSHIKNVRFVMGKGPKSKGVREFIEKDLPYIQALNRGLFTPVIEIQDDNVAPHVSAHHYGANADNRDVSFKTREDILQIFNEFMDDALALKKTNKVQQYEWHLYDIVDAYDDELFIQGWVQTGNPEDVEMTTKEFNFARWKTASTQEMPTRGDIDLPYTEYDIL